MNKICSGLPLADFLYVIAVGLYTKLGLILVRYSMRKQEYEADKSAYDRLW
ncbi:hypothetical protein [Leptotrichia wadei]|uniref:hypothetical protein n=1 Tax=Leptotrichia wadei TaxID=157687 RepID=UPI00155A9309|nr:hypothetical protein [Leptotrichia wadei]